jgi:hypothetical protein
MEAAHSSKNLANLCQTIWLTSHSTVNSFPSLEQTVQKLNILRDGQELHIMCTLYAVCTKKRKIGSGNLNITSDVQETEK